MKRFSFWIIISLLTFSVGFGSVLAWLYYNQKEIVEISPVPKIENDRIKSKSFPGLSKEISKLKKGESGYFPKAIFDNSDFFADYYGTYLKAMDEPSLLNVPINNPEIYRFLWLGSRQQPIFVRIEKTDNSIQLFSKELNGTGNSDPGKVFRKVNKTLDATQWNEFLALLEKSQYWRMPNGDKIGRDGTQWILEGVKEGRYHIVDRWSPENGEYREVCIYLLKLSGFDTDRLKNELY